MNRKLTNAEYAILGMLVERPCHGYDLERLIEQRGMRDWTELAFSSIYYLLKKLEKYQLVEIRESSASKTRKIYAPTSDGYALHIETTKRMLAEPGPNYPSVLLGIANWPSLEPELALASLLERRTKLEATLKSVIDKTQPGPAFIEVLFDYSISQIQSEIDWIERALNKFGEDHEQN